MSLTEDLDSSAKPTRCPNENEIYSLQYRQVKKTKMNNSLLLTINQHRSMMFADFKVVFPRKLVWRKTLLLEIKLGVCFWPYLCHWSGLLVTTIAATVCCNAAAMFATCTRAMWVK